MLLTFTLIIINTPSPPHSLIPCMQALNIPFLQTLPTVAFLFFFRTDSADSLDHLPIHLDIPVFYFLAFLFELGTLQPREPDGAVGHRPPSSGVRTLSTAEVVLHGGVGRSCVWRGRCRPTPPSVRHSGRCCISKLATNARTLGLRGEQSPAAVSS